jgi:alpha-tubulin suppressor-like RCC1 family protein
MKRQAASLVIMGLVASVGVRAQAPKRLPIITGNGLVNVLVEVDGTVKTWGDPARLDPSPPLGNGIRPSDQPEVKSPQALPGVRDVVGASVGVEHVLLLKGDGTVLAWGDNDQCELGTGTDKGSLVPVPVPGLRGVTEISAGAWASAAVLSDGTVWMWGETAPERCVKVPAKVEGLAGVKRLAFDGDSALVLKDDGTVWGWGRNKNGELCDGTTEPRLNPVQVKGVADAVDVALDGNSIIVLADGTVRMCGSNDDGGLGDPAKDVTQHLTPFRVPGLTGVRSARTTAGSTIVQLADGTLRAWGLGWYGALGDGHGDSSSATPRAPIGLGPVLAHYMSHNTSYAIRADGTVMAWGGLLAPPGSKTEFILTPSPAFTVKLNE